MAGISISNPLAGQQLHKSLRRCAVKVGSRSWSLVHGKQKYYCHVHFMLSVLEDHIGFIYVFLKSRGDDPRMAGRLIHNRFKAQKGVKL